MQILLNILSDFRTTIVRLYKTVQSYKLRTKIILIIILVVALGVFLYGGRSTVTETVTESTPIVVSVKSISELNVATGFNTIGKVESVSEANLKTETGGRVTGVYVTVGEKVAAGKVLASIQNDLQRASLLQAEGAYEAAKAGAAQSNIGINQSENSVTAAINNATNANRNAYTTAYSVITNSLDQFYGSPTKGIIGLRVITGDTVYFNSERMHFREALLSWSTATQEPLTEANVLSQTETSIIETTRLRDLVSAFIKIVAKAPIDDYLLGQPLNSYAATLLVNESTLNASLANLANAKTSFQTSLEARNQANLSGSSEVGVVSSANAQVKIALGSLRAAQANYEKTIVRSPITGVINALYLKTGDYVSPSEPAAVVANNESLEIKTYVSEADSVNLKVGDTVRIETSATGTITAKAGAIDPTNGKIEIRISIMKSETITNGSTVKVTFSNQVTDDAKIIIPLASLKLSASGPSVFVVNSDNKLEAQAVVLGDIAGENVVVTSGLSTDTKIVVDARGLKNGQLVTVK